MIHAIISFFFAILFAVFDAPFFAYLFVPAFYIGREVAQAEYRYIEANGGIRANCSSLCGLFPSAWTLKGLIDWIFPLFSSLGVYLLQKLFGFAIY